MACLDVLFIQVENHLKCYYLTKKLRYFWSESRKENLRWIVLFGYNIKEFHIVTRAQFSDCKPKDV